ncbi:hypothetical protein D3C71_842640 [compost metagenome]
MLDQLAGLHWQAEAVPIGRGADGELPLRSGNRNRNHVLRDQFSKTHAGIVMFGDDIEFLVRHDDIKLHFGMHVRKACKQWPG